MKRITKLFISLAMIISFITMDVDAATYTTLTSTLDLATKTDDDVDGSEYGYYWDSSELTLTVYGLTIETSSALGIKLPDGATIILSGDLKVTTSSIMSSAIYCKGVFSIEGTGDVYLDAPLYGMYFGDYTDDGVSDTLLLNYDGDLTINTACAIYNENFGCGDASATILLSGDLTIPKSSTAIEVNNNLTIDVGGDLIISNTGYGIKCDNATITVGGSLSIIATSDGIQVNDATIVVGEKLSINAGTNAIYVEDSLDMLVGEDLSISASYTGILAKDANITVGGDASINAGTAAISVDDTLGIVVAGDTVFDNLIYIGSNSMNTYTIDIDSLVMEGWVYTEYNEQENTPVVSASINDEFTNKYTGEITYTYYEDANCEKEVDDIASALAGTYYVKASIASSTDDSNNVTIGTYAITEFEILTKYYTVSIDGVEDEVAYGTIVTLGTPTKDGYTFDGWVDEDDEVYSGEITVTSDLILSSTWTEIIDDSTDGNTDLDVDANTDDSTDSDTNVDVNDDIVDTGDTNNILLFASLSTAALALILVDMKKRVRV